MERLLVVTTSSSVGGDQEGSWEILWTTWNEPSKSVRMRASLRQIYWIPEAGWKREDPVEDFWDSSGREREPDHPASGEDIDQR